jgi:hypothetical protein
MLLASFPLAGLVISTIKETTYEVGKAVYVSDLNADGVGEGKANVDHDSHEDVKKE